MKNLSAPSYLHCNLLDLLSVHLLYLILHFILQFGPQVLNFHYFVTNFTTSGLTTLEVRVKKAVIGGTTQL